MISIATLALVAGLLLGACARREVAKEASNATMPDSMAAAVTLNAAQIQHGGVRWAPASVGAEPAQGLSPATLPGQLVPNEDRTARLGAPGQGRVVTMQVSPGQRVSAGQVLVRLQSPEAGMAQSELAKATAAVTSKRAQLTFASSARDRAERLLALKAIPRQDYERAVAEQELARAELAQAEAELRRAQSTAASLGAAGTASGVMAVRSPLGGVVLERTAAPGTVVETGAPLVIVTDLSSLWLTVNAPEAMAGLLRVGATVRFVVPAYPADTFVARLSVVGAGLDPETRTLAGRALVANRSGRLKPAMLASVLLPAAPTNRATPTTVISLPADAVQLLDGKPTVFVARPDGKGGAGFQARTVVTGPRLGNEIEITRGVEPGELVVVQGATAVKAEIRKGAMPKMVM